jgi:hypothetical protein
MMPELRPLTLDQEFLAAILEEQKRIRLLLEALFEGGELECEECHKTFRNDRALRAHMRVHKG